MRLNKPGSISSFRAALSTCDVVAEDMTPEQIGQAHSRCDIFQNEHTPKSVVSVFGFAGLVYGLVGRCGKYAE